MLIDNIRIFHETMKIAQKGRYLYDDREIVLKLTAEQMAQVEVFSRDRINGVFSQVHPDESAGPAGKRIQTRVSACDSFEAAIRLSGGNMAAEHPKNRVLVLNFANALHPGGGVKSGERAQEEDLCRKSTLYCSLTARDAEVMYQYNASLKNHLASDYMLLSPHVEILRDTKGKLLSETCLVSVLTAAAPRITFGMGGLSESELRKLLAKRIRAIFTVAAYGGYQKLVLGAWGCGAFGNDPDEMAPLFADEIEYWSASGTSPFKQIEFAVLKGSNRNSRNYVSFARQFSTQD
ncbi:MAG: TIGR02452 family protein [Lachnospiraceae bacterium]|nr:TIGR02452 family protein [Lachnospiraceae bacterium]